MKLDVKAFALSCGLIWGVGLFLITWWIIALDGSATTPTFLGRVYRGYSMTPVGSLIGLGWGLLDGAIGGAVFAALYNLMARPRANA